MPEWFGVYVWILAALVLTFAAVALMIWIIGLVGGYAARQNEARRLLAEKSARDIR